MVAPRANGRLGRIEARVDAIDSRTRERRSDRDWLDWLASHPTASTGDLLDAALEAVCRDALGLPDGEPISDAQLGELAGMK